MQTPEAQTEEKTEEKTEQRLALKPRQLLREECFTVEEFAVGIGRTVETVWRWWRLGIGPGWVKIGGKRHIPQSVARAWLRTAEQPVRGRPRLRDAQEPVRDAKRKNLDRAGMRARAQQVRQEQARKSKLAE
jgi:hypothetical protein